MRQVDLYHYEVAPGESITVEVIPSGTAPALVQAELDGRFVSPQAGPYPKYLIQLPDEEQEHYFTIVGAFDEPATTKHSVRVSSSKQTSFLGPTIDLNQ